MSIQFSRSMRSLRLDSFRVARIGLVLAIINMVVLIIWFFSAKVTLYETSSSIQVTSEGHLLATFPAEAQARIHPGQPAILRINAGTGQPPITLPLFVFDMQQEDGQVDLLILDPSFSPTSLSENPNGRVEVEVEYVSPAELVLRASGKYLNQNQVPVSPQSLQNQEQ